MHDNLHAYESPQQQMDKFEQHFTQFLQVESQESPSTPKSIKGKIKLNGRFYETSCACSDAALTSSCNPPFRLHVHQETLNSEVGLSKGALKKLLGKPTAFKLTDVEKSSFSCIDGRDPRSLLGTPAGDFGEFLIALQIYESLTNSTFTPAKIQEYLADWLMLAPQPMYFHTDEAARSLLESNLMVNGVRGVVGLNLEKPLLEQQAELLLELVKGSYNGCYVIKSILAEPRRFYFRKGLVTGAITSLYQILWDKKRQGPQGPLYKKINFVVSQGAPTEKAWINFRGNHRCEDDKKAPLFSPKSVSGTQVFVNHPEAVVVLRTMLARFFLTRSPPALVTLPEFVGYLNRQGLFVMETAAETLGNSRVPFYTVQVE